MIAKQARAHRWTGAARRTIFTVFGLAIMVVMLVGSVEPAAAQTAPFSCAGTLDTSFSPGAVMDKRQINVRALYPFMSGCQSADPAYTHGILIVHFHEEFSCVENSGNAKFHRVDIRWNTNEVSTIALDGSMEVSQRRFGEYFLVFRSRIIDGPFLGNDVEVQSVAYHINPANCMTTEGVQGQEGPFQLTIGLESTR